MKILKFLIYSTIVSLLLISCGGGGTETPGDNGGTDPINIDPNAAKWDTMVWGTDNWN